MKKVPATARRRRNRTRAEWGQCAEEPCWISPRLFYPSTAVSAFLPGQFRNFSLLTKVQIPNFQIKKERRISHPAAQSPRGRVGRRFTSTASDADSPPPRRTPLLRNRAGLFQSGAARPAPPLHITAAGLHLLPASVDAPGPRRRRRFNPHATRFGRVASRPRSTNSELLPPLSQIEQAAVSPARFLGVPDSIHPRISPPASLPRIAVEP